ncbi:MAG TPA: hypothetical protein DHM44_03875 [Flexistipes sinusarabici]|uniref:Uncharacterized protein n=1 Tax=Flexistipes sinusarabici TaxID=2352 RepID=A0A3D5QAC4_FLESI|nr:hypothetical protein [Flexistipes sinusarabici]
MRKFKVGDTVSFKDNCIYFFKSNNPYGVIKRIVTKDYVVIKVIDELFSNTKGYYFSTKWIKKLK